MEKDPIHKIIHVDMDAFYASVEQRDNPKLKGKPVAVGYAAKRGVVAAASYEARAFGIHSAMPSVTAMRLCQKLVFIPPRFDIYHAVSRQIHTIFARYTDLIEPLSLDEAYLDVTENKQNIPTAWETAKAIRAEIFQETGLTASAGISYNKFLAKTASGRRKPNGQFVIIPEMGESFIATLPIADFYGVGPATAKKMHILGIQTGADLKARSLENLKEHFGKVGAWYYDIARGNDYRMINTHRERKSSSSETTFPEDLFDQASIEMNILSMANDVWRWSEKTGQRGRTVTIKIKWGDFKISTRSRSSKDQIIVFEEFRRITIDLVRSMLPSTKGIRLVGVGLSNFTTDVPLVSVRGTLL